MSPKFYANVNLMHKAHTHTLTHPCQISTYIRVVVSSRQINGDTSFDKRNKWIQKADDMWNIQSKLKINYYHEVYAARSIGSQLTSRPGTYHIRSHTCAHTRSDFGRKYFVFLLKAITVHIKNNIRNVKRKIRSAFNLSHIWLFFFPSLVYFMRLSFCFDERVAIFCSIAMPYIFACSQMFHMSNEAANGNSNKMNVKIQSFGAFCVHCFNMFGPCALRIHWLSERSRKQREL